ncbi:MAG: Hpt domain-containing protein [Winogradskyella sp.]|nr:Hpt domain-containing protein [Winogradskyella sp.]
MEQPNLRYIEQLSAGEETFKQKLISIIKKEFPTEVQTYNSNLDAKKYSLAADNVHKLKHKISILGLEKSYKVAQDHENQLRDNNLDLKNAFNGILIIISNFLDTV